MNYGPDATWPEVTREVLLRIADSFQSYRRDAWGDATLYRDNHSGDAIFGYELLDGRCFLHPDIERS